MNESLARALADKLDKAAFEINLGGKRMAFKSIIQIPVGIQKDKNDKPLLDKNGVIITGWPQEEFDKAVSSVNYELTSLKTAAKRFRLWRKTLYAMPCVRAARLAGEGTRPDNG